MMAIKSGFFNSVNGDRKYDARFFAEYFATFISNGVFPNPSTNLQVVEGENMQTIVKPGKGWINGYYIVNDSDYILQHDIADGVLKRIDRVVMRLNYLTREIEIDIKKGTFASNPVAPTLQRDTDAYELALADVYINNGATQITQANITDLRLNTELCGIVHGTVDQVDTTTLFNQYQSWIAQQKLAYETELVNWTSDKKAEFESWKTLQEIDFDTWRTSVESSFEQWMLQEQTDFETWFATLKDLLDENIAATLTTKVQALETSVQDLQTNKANSTDLATLSQTVMSHFAEKGQPNGYASLDESGKVPNAQLPPLDFIPVSQKGVSNGVATLGNDGLIPPEQIPDISSGTWEVLSSVSIDSPTNIIEFNNLPTDYDFFKIYTKNLMGDGTGSGYDSLFLRINDISANYSHNTWLNIQGDTSINLTSAQDTANSFQLTGALTKPSQIFTASFEVTIYNSANKEKSIIANGVSFNYKAPDTKITQVRVVGVSREIHDKTINKISITAGAQIKVGGKVILMGCKA